MMLATCDALLCGGLSKMKVVWSGFLRRVPLLTRTRGHCC